MPGEGDPASDLMFVGEAPGYHEDQQGRPFVGQAGKLLEQLLATIGLTREQVFIANVLKSRPPNNRDPRPDEIAACQPYLWRQIELIRPKVICTLGNHATKLLTGNPAGITRVHGHPQATEIGGVSLYLYPIFHPGRGALHAGDADDAQGGLPAAPRVARARRAGRRAAGRGRPAWRPPERPRARRARGAGAALTPAEPWLPRPTCRRRAAVRRRRDRAGGRGARRRRRRPARRRSAGPAPPGKPEQLGLF